MSWLVINFGRRAHRPINMVVDITSPVTANVKIPRDRGARTRADCELRHVSLGRDLRVVARPRSSEARIAWLAAR